MKSIILLAAVVVLCATLFPSATLGEFIGEQCKQAGQACYEGSEAYHQYDVCCQSNFVCDYDYPQKIGKATWPGTCFRRTSNYVQKRWVAPPRDY